jgi:hypothetical protein
MKRLRRDDRRDVAPVDEPSAREAEPRAQDPIPDRWSEPVPVMKDRDGHLHVLF